MGFIYDEQGNIIRREPDKPKKKIIPSPSLTSEAPIASPSRVSPPATITGAGMRGRQAIPEAFSKGGLRGRITQTPEEKEAEFQKGVKEKKAGAAIQVGKETSAQKAKAAEKSARNTKKFGAQIKQSLLKWGMQAAQTQKVTGLSPDDPNRKLADRDPLIAKYYAAKSAKSFSELLNVRKVEKLTDFLDQTNKNKKIRSFTGDLIETAISGAKIAAPAAKVGPEMIKTFSQTLMEPDDSSIDARDQAINSLANSRFANASGMPEIYPKDVLDINEFRKLAEKEVDDYIKSKPAVFKNIFPNLFEPTTKTEKPTEKRVDIIDKEGNEFDVPESQLQEALNQGYRRK